MGIICYKNSFDITSYLLSVLLPKLHSLKLLEPLTLPPSLEILFKWSDVRLLPRLRFCLLCIFQRVQCPFPNIWLEAQNSDWYLLGWLTRGWESCHSRSWLPASEITPIAPAAIKLNERRQALNRKMNETHKRDTKQKKGPAAQAGRETLPSAWWAPCVLALLLGLLCLRASRWKRGRKNADVLGLEAGESGGPPPVLGDTSFFDKDWRTPDVGFRLRTACR